MTGAIQMTKAKAYYLLSKFRLSMTTAFSGGFGYALAVDKINWLGLFMVMLAGFLMSASASAINGIIEIESDKLMRRTQNRPLPLGILTIKEAQVFSLLTGLIAMGLFFGYFNWRAGILALLSHILYSFVYTPLKKKGTIAVFVGAFPGAFPPMIGWLAATNKFGLEPGILFAIQFFWQFPHFWAIAWVADEDYKKAGFKLLPGVGKKDFDTAVQIMIYTIFLLPLCWVPYLLKMTGINSAIIAMMFGIVFLAQTFNLMRKVSDKAALQLMFGSFLYLMVVQVAYLLDKV
jgi:heme o synthase